MFSLFVHHQLKAKKVVLKDKVKDLELQIQHLNSQLQQQLSISKPKRPKNGVLKVLQKRVASQHSDDGVSKFL